MQVRNAAYNKDGSIDAEIEHPDLGWIPTTLVNGDAGLADEYAAAVALGPTPFVETPETIAAEKVLLRSDMHLTFRQLLIGLGAEGWITTAEGRAWQKGVLPNAVMTLINSLPTEAERYAAEITAVSPSVVLRSDPLVGSLAVAEGKTDDELDAFFTTYAVV